MYYHTRFLTQDMKKPVLWAFFHPLLKQRFVGERVCVGMGSYAVNTTQQGVKGPCSPFKAMLDVVKTYKHVSNIIYYALSIYILF